MLDYLDAKDKALFESTPMFMAPRFGTLPELAVGQRRLISAADGIYIEVRSKALHVCRKIATINLPYGKTTAFIKPVYGAVSNAILQEAYAYAAKHPDIEVACCLIADEQTQSYRWYYPENLSQSGSHITYRDDVDDQLLVIDFHSHGNHGAGFSLTDDDSDLRRPGPYLAMIMGRCHQPEQATFTTRLVCPPYLMPLPSKPL